MSILPRSIIAATTNENKLRELRTVAAEFSVEIVSAVELARGMPVAVDETGTSYLENARLKARTYVDYFKLPAIGDDSGLEVEILSGEPGLFSARYLGAEASYPERMQSLITRVTEQENKLGIKNRRAKFCCALVLTFPDGREYEAESSLEGELLDAPRGSRGFGYDPLIEINALKKTLAEVEFEITCAHGFRGKALRTLFNMS